MNLLFLLRLGLGLNSLCQQSPLACRSDWTRLRTASPSLKHASKCLPLSLVLQTAALFHNCKVMPRPFDFSMFKQIQLDKISFDCLSSSSLEEECQQAWHCPLAALECSPRGGLAQASLFSWLFLPALLNTVV